MSPHPAPSDETGNRFQAPRHATGLPLAALARTLILVALCWCVLPDEVSALDPDRTVFQYNNRTWRRAGGLPANAVRAIVQVGDGHIWLGTAKGLVDFDGVEFREIGLPGQPESRPRIIANLAPRTLGGLWVAIERGGNGSFESGRFTPLQQASLGGEFPTTRVLHEGRDGALYVALVGTLGRRFPSGEAEVLSPEADVLCMHEDARGRIWMGTAAHGLLYWDGGLLHRVGGAAESLWRGYVIAAVAVDHEGLIWVGASNGLHCLNPDLSPRPPTGVDSQPRALLVDSHGLLWVGTLAEGLLRRKDGVFTRLLRSDGLASDRILALAESDDGSLWIGTEDGLSQLSDVKFPIISASEGLAAEACLSVAAAPDGGVWAGTSNGLTRIKDGRCTSFGRDRADGFGSEWIKRLFVARNGDVYFLGGRRDLNRFRGDRVVKTWVTDGWPQVMAEDSQGIILAMGTKLLRIEEDELVPYRLANGTVPTFGWINDLVVARDGSLWVAAKPGLAQIRNGVVCDWLLELKQTDRAFFHLCEDDRGAIWATRNSGLVLIKDARLRTVDHTQGLHSDLVYAMVPDHRGNLWMDSPAGIFRVSQDELEAAAADPKARVTCTVYDGQHAVKTSEKSTREYSRCRSADGRIWFPSSVGVICIDPVRVPTEARPPRTYIQRVLVDGREFPAGVEPVLQPGSGNLELDYAALDYLAPERIRYRYRLEGYQADWVDAGARRSAFFTNLDPGRYRFQVQACNADGVWNTAGAVFSLTLPRRWNDTWWFRGSIILIALGFLAYAWHTRDRRRRRELAEVRHREELQRLMIDSSPVAMAMIDHDRRVLHTNATFTRLFGYSADEVPDLDSLCRRLCPDSVDRVAWLAALSGRLEAAAALGRAIEPLETNVACKDGTVRTIIATTSAVGERTLLVCSDLTEHKRAEDDRRRLEEQLRQGQKMEAIGRLSGGVAHDFNNLLTVILGNLMLVETFERIPADIAEMLAEIKEAAKRAANLTRQLLAFSRKQPMHAAAIDLNHVVSEMARMLHRILGEDVRLDLQLAAGAMPIHADANMLEQVVLNLAVNARDAMPRGGRLVLSTASVDIAADAVPSVPNARPGRFVRLLVQDTGSGIPAELLPRIFEPFFTTKDVGKGTGLGLATVYGIVEQHHGWIDVASDQGHGTTFRVHLPHGLAETAAEPARTVLTGAAPNASLTILLVEDDNAVRALARRTLVAHGHRVLEAVSGPAALNLWARHREEIDLLLTDVVMPDGLNGLELARRLLADRPTLRVIYTSGYSAEVAGGDFSGREGLDFLPKPYDPDTLLRIVAGTSGQSPVP